MYAFLPKRENLIEREADMFGIAEVSTTGDRIVIDYADEATAGAGTGLGDTGKNRSMTLAHMARIDCQLEQAILDRLLRAAAAHRASAS